MSTRLLQFLVMFISIFFVSSYSLAAASNQSAETEGHAKKKGSDVSHYVMDQKEQARIEGDLSKGKGHAAKTEGMEHFDQGEAAKESAEAGETLESHPHSHKETSGVGHYEPNK